MADRLFSPHAVAWSIGSSSEAPASPPGYPLPYRTAQFWDGVRELLLAHARPPEGEPLGVAHDKLLLARLQAALDDEDQEAAAQAREPVQWSWGAASRLLVRARLEVQRLLRTGRDLLLPRAHGIRAAPSWATTAVLPALRESRGSARGSVVWVSSDADRYADRVAALDDAALRPTAFEHAVTDWVDSLPDDDAALRLRQIQDYLQEELPRLAVVYGQHPVDNLGWWIARQMLRWTKRELKYGKQLRLWPKRLGKSGDVLQRKK